MNNIRKQTAEHFSKWVRGKIKDPPAESAVKSLASINDDLTDKVLEDCDLAAEDFFGRRSKAYNRYARQNTQARIEQGIELWTCIKEEIKMHVSAMKTKRREMNQ